MESDRLSDNKRAESDRGGKGKNICGYIREVRGSEKNTWRFEGCCVEAPGSEKTWRFGGCWVEASGSDKGLCFGGCWCEPLAAIRDFLERARSDTSFFRESGCEAPPAKRLIF
ncbi:hypothetical protein TNCV_5061362 [Trichonephila clavipes]|nr:hypothetical protein TNCV_5061362 [Trichonephila clavipes]